MRRVKDIMTHNPACCTAETPLPDLAQLMIDHDWGEIPVAESDDSHNPIGVVTDRDIVCRAVAQGKNTATATAGECMTRSCVTVTPETTLEECIKVLEEAQI